MNSAGQGRNRFATSTIRRRRFFRSFAEAADFSDLPPNSRIFAAHISVR